MKNIVHLVLLLAVIGTNSAFAQNNSEDLGTPFIDMEQMMEEMMRSFNQAFEDSRMQMEGLDLKKLDEQGWMSIDGDSLNISSFFDFFPQGFEQLPEGMRPSEEYFEGLEENSKMLPDLLLRSAELFKAEDMEQLFEEMKKQLGEDGQFFYYQYPPNGDNPKGTPQDTKEKKSIRI